MGFCDILFFWKDLVLLMFLGTALDYMESAVTYAEHAGRQEMTVEDVKLAVQSKISAEFTGPPPREVRLNHTRAKYNMFSYWLK
jgi:hypothetical protein